MRRICYTAKPALENPASFADEAFRDLNRAWAISWPLFLSNLRARYRASYLGYIWLLMPALGTTLICVYLQSRRIVDVGTTDLPYPIHVLAGIILWQGFIEALNAPLQRLSAGRQLITRSRVPHEALILAGFYEVLLNAAIRLAVMMAALVGLGLASGTSILLVPFGMVMLGLFGLALGLAAAPWGLLYDDVGRAMLFATSIWFFLTPVIYPAQKDGWLRYNPVTPLLEATRSWLTSAGASGGFFVVSAGAVLLLIAAWLFYRLARPHVVARLG